MDSDFILLLRIFSYVCGLSGGVIIGFMLGKYIERKSWNDLVREGKLPKPNDRWVKLN